MIGERLRRLMAERGLSAARLAKDADVKPSFIYDVLHGKSTNPSIVKLARLANRMQVGIAALLDGEEQYRMPAVNGHSHGGKKRLLQLDTAPADSYAAIPNVLAETSPYGGLKENSGSCRFRRDWIRDRLGVSPADLRMIVMCGDSMEPSLCAGDMILIDITRKIPTPPGIFVLFDGFGPVAKRLEFVASTTPPAIRIISDNPQYGAYERTIDELHIMGRVVWFARELP